MNRKIFTGFAAMIMAFSVFGDLQSTALSRTQKPSNWRENTSGEMTITYDKTEDAVCFQTEFSDQKSFWVYPEYLLKLPQESLKNAKYIEFEVKADPTAEVRIMYLMVLWNKQGKKQKPVYIQTQYPKEDWGVVRVALSKAKIDPADMTGFRIGLTSKGGDVTYWIRNIRVLYDR